MKSRWWISLCIVSILAATCSGVCADKQGRGDDEDNYKYKDKNKDKDKDKGKDKDKYKYKEKYKEKDGRETEVVFVDHDRVVMREWYVERKGNGKLPPGLAKKDRLPPDLERQLLIRGELTPALRERIEPCPEELEERLPPPPPDYAHVIIGGHIVLLNRRTSVVVDILHLEF